MPRNYSPTQLQIREIISPLIYSRWDDFVVHQLFTSIQFVVLHERILRKEVYLDALRTRAVKFILRSPGAKFECKTILFDHKHDELCDLMLQSYGEGQNFIHLSDGVLKMHIPREYKDSLAFLYNTEFLFTAPTAHDRMRAFQEI